MKANRHYAPLVEECLLLSMTNAAFLIQLSLEIKNESLSKRLLALSEALETQAQRLLNLIGNRQTLQLNPALIRRPTGQLDKDLQSAVSDALKLKSRLMLLVAFAPSASLRREFMDFIADLRPLIGGVSSEIQ